VTILHIQPFGGMAGDMFLASLLDLGDPRFTLDQLRALAQRLVPGEAMLATERAWRGSLSGCLLRVETPETTSPPQRGIADLEQLIDGADLSQAVADRSKAVLWRIARAEARVHGTTPEEIHFHEVGAVDTIIDVCGAVLALELLGVRRVLSSPPLTGEGTVECAHGTMPVPAPAVAELLRGLPVTLGGGAGERLTPTAAALLAELVDAFEAPGAFVTSAVGYGAGTRDPREGPPNIMRVQLGEAGEQAQGDAAEIAQVWLMEVNLDDMTAEEVGHAVGELRAAGALEVWTSPVFMKKDRPAVVVSALVRDAQRPALEASLFEWTTTLGLRWSRVERRECGRRFVTVAVGGFTVDVKVRERPEYAGRSPLGERDLAPEHDHLVLAASGTGLTLREARGRAVAAALELLDAE
jgi:uncharacterized protein (TIGR00299 family) protein